MRPHQDSNLGTRFRRPVLYPLSYGGSLTSESLSVPECALVVPRSLRLTTHAGLMG